MSKVKKEVVEAAALKLLANITATMPTPTYKFLLGSISALATINNGQKIHEMLGLVADNDGYIDVTMIKTLINGGFEASGGKITLDLFNNQNGLLSLFIKPLTLTITKDDI
jgi:phage tail sheath gpL-like